MLYSVIYVLLLCKVLCDHTMPGQLDWIRNYFTKTPNGIKCVICRKICANLPDAKCHLSRAHGINK